MNLLKQLNESYKMKINKKTFTVQYANENLTMAELNIIKNICVCASEAHLIKSAQQNYIEEALKKCDFECLPINYIKLNDVAGYIVNVRPNIGIMVLWGDYDYD